ncbi:NAD(P)-dependent oxidoreductase [Halobacillus salinus]|uniref:SDR family oxidoreductase n=1 Tax=Halobacillus salinus TaxID=192814 RepID=A0A4Z0H5M1_9BACI|nr:SDR family oxidoreductase [Halobacillus salinus]TGB05320.1 SDR family oxidoreductase [Halobacillus salinus]
MKIAIFGASGRVGQQVLQKAIEDGHEVRALVRRPQDHLAEGKVELVYGDAKKEKDVYETIKGCDVVFSGLNTDKSDTLSVAIPYMIKAMEKENISRIVTIGTAGILDSRNENGKFRFQTNESKRKSTFAAEEHAKAFRYLEKSKHDWTIVCPTYLPDGEEEGNIRFEQNHLPEGGRKITVGDTAQFAYEELLKNRFNQSRVGICY